MIMVTGTNCRIVVLMIGLTILSASGSRDSSIGFARSRTLAHQRRQPVGVDVREPDSRPLKVLQHQIALSKTKKLNLYLPAGFEITVAASGLKRPRFLAKSPDGRIFVTEMYNRTDNQKGTVYVLEGFDAKAGKFNHLTAYLRDLRNPNSIAFYTDRQGDHWFYLALTDRLLRYRYAAGETAPAGGPEVIANFPDYGLSYKYGGWHLTRTIAVGAGKLYVSVGSSCNACEEGEPIRATVLEMDLDGKNQRVFASGLRNAVGMKVVQDQLFVTDMGADHLGDVKPDDTMYIVEQNRNYGWPYCFEHRKHIYGDPEFVASEKWIDCRSVPLAHVGFSAHSSPLGFEYFDSSNDSSSLKDSFLVALHGSSKRSLRRGYSLMQVRKGGSVRDFITGFLRNGKVYGRPADIMRVGKNSFLFTDDYAGVVYYVFQP
jgi:glucose/arabinose dehydrogenase